MTKDEIIAKQAAIIAQQAAYIEELEEQLPIFKAGLAHAFRRISELEAELQTNSHTSSRPPSSDGIKKQPALPRKRGGQRGGKPGHKGKTLKMIPTQEVDNHVIHPVEESHCSCGQSLAQAPVSVSLERRQVFDLPPQLLEVVEHRRACKHCPGCGKLHKGQFPQGVNAPVQYGKRVKALTTLLSVEHSMPVGRIGELFANLTSYGLNENTVQSTLSKVADEVTGDLAIIKEQLLSSQVAHADESGARVAGKLHWIHNLVTDKFTYFFVHEKRGAKALYSEQSPVQHYEGILVHDCWASYFGLKGADHALCGAHLLRELKGLADHHQRKWAHRMHDLLMYAYQFSDYGRSTLSIDKQQIVAAQYRRILKQAQGEEPPAIIRPRGRPKKTKGRNLLERLDKYQQQVLLFAHLEQVPFTNNQAERDIRPWKTKLKVSGCFRTLQGAQTFADIKSFCSTAKKHGLSVYQEICYLIEGKSFLNKVSVAT